MEKEHLEKKTTSAEQLELNLPPNSFSATDPQLVDRLGVDCFFKLLDYAGSDELKERFSRLSRRDERSIFDLLLTCESVFGFQKFIKALDAVATMSDADGANILVSANAAEPEERSAEVAVNAFKSNPDIFNLALKKKVTESPIPKRSYKLYRGCKSLPPPRQLSDKKMGDFKEFMCELYGSRKWGKYCSPWLIKNKAVVGVLIEHGSSKTGYSTVDDSDTPLTSLLRLRKTDIIFMDKETGIVWVSTIARNKAFAGDMVRAFGKLLYGDERTFDRPFQPHFSDLFKSGLKNSLESPRDANTSHMELRGVGVNHGRDGKCYTYIPGPSRKGCLLDLPDWENDLPASSKVNHFSIAIELNGGEREEADITQTGIKLACSSLLPEMISALQDLRVIPSGDH